MLRRSAFRVCLLACLLVPALAMITSAVHAQYGHTGGPQWERSWKCARCGGYLGNGVQRPTHCHHCAAKSNSGSTASKGDKSKGTAPAVTIALIGVGVLCVVGVTIYMLSGSSSTQGGGA